MNDEHIDFCTSCRKWTKYKLTKTPVKVMVNGREQTVMLTTAVCCKCGAYMSFPNWIDINNKEIQEQTNGVLRSTTDAKS